MGDVYEVVEGRVLQRQVAYAAAPPATGIWFEQQAQTYTDDSGGGGVVAEVSFNRWDQPTIAASVATVYTDVATVKIEGAPIAGLNATLTNSYSLWVDDGLVRFDGQVLGADGAIGAPSYSALSGRDRGMFFPAANTVGFSSAGVERMRVGPGGIIFIGDGTTTTNANMTIGWTVQQNANNDEAGAFKSTVVAHGITDVAETDTYGLFEKCHDTAGGLHIRGLRNAGGQGGNAIIVNGLLGEAADTTKTIASVGVVKLQGHVTDGGTGVATLPITGNLVSAVNRNTTTVIIDGGGRIHLDLGGNGTLAAPSLTLGADVDSGWYLSAADQWSYSGGGAEIMRVAAFGVDFRAGSVFSSVTINPRTNVFIVWGTGGEILTRYNGTSWEWGINGADSRWNDAAIAAFAADADLDAEDTYWRFQDGGPATGATAGFDGATLTTTTGDGSDAGGGVNNGGDGGDLLYQLGNGGAGIGGGVAGADGRVIFDLVDSSDSPDVLPGGDDEGRLGEPSTRWALVRGRVITSGDLNFENDWKFTEAWDDGTWGSLDKGVEKKTKGLYIFNHIGERVAWLDNEGNIHARGQFISGWVPA